MTIPSERSSGVAKLCLVVIAVLLALLLGFNLAYLIFGRQPKPRVDPVPEKPALAEPTAVAWADSGNKLVDPGGNRFRVDHGYLPNGQMRWRAAPVKRPGPKIVPSVPKPVPKPEKQEPGPAADESAE
jgi:hypothetical protein